MNAAQSTCIHPDFSSRKPSLPIEIPNRRRTVASVLTLSPISPTSPDLLFDMSPVAPSFSPTQLSLGFPEPAQKPRAHEPFLYTFPKFSIQKGCGSGHKMRPTQTTRKRSSPVLPPGAGQTQNISPPSVSGGVTRTRAFPAAVTPLKPITNQKYPSGRIDAVDASLSLETDPGIPFEFEQLLMRRIEDRHQTRPQRPSLLSKIRR